MTQVLSTHCESQRSAVDCPRFFGTWQEFTVEQIWKWTMGTVWTEKRSVDHSHSQSQKGVRESMIESIFESDCDSTTFVSIEQAWIGWDVQAVLRISNCH